MTKHNIRDHLNWLIKCGSSQPSQPVYVNAAQSLLDDRPSLQKFGRADDYSTDLRALQRDVGSLHSEPQFARPSLPASILNAHGGNTMARLQSGPKSGHKPRLLSEAVPLSLQTPTSSSTPRAPGTSLKDRYNARWERRAPGEEFKFSTFINSAEY